ncbi:MAG TPA: hypothetical protein VK137_00810 [Planctomycetaceae bacterium]|nr:hypothetical protein [Planctomycetaceae bacterium]
MQIPIVIEPLPNNRFRAQSSSPLSMIVEGDSAEESLRLWREKFSSCLPTDAEVQVVSPSAIAPSLPPWAKYIGELKDDPLLDEWREGVEEYRKQRDREAGVE